MEDILYSYCLDRYGDVWRFERKYIGQWQNEITHADRYDRNTGVWQIGVSVPMQINDSWTPLTEDSAIQLIKNINAKRRYDGESTLVMPGQINAAPTTDAKAAILDRIHAMLFDSATTAPVNAFSTLAKDIQNLYAEHGHSTIPDPNVPSVTLSGVSGPEVIVEDYPCTEEPKRRLTRLRLTIGNESTILDRKDVHRLALALVNFGACGSIELTSKVAQ